MSSEQCSMSSLLLPLPTKRLAPHCLFFLFFNLVYFLPLLGVVLFNYEEGTSIAADLDREVMAKITWIYLLGIVAFVCGSGLNTFLGRMTNRKTEPRGALQLFRLSPSFWVLCSVTIAVFALSKVLLRPLGVYSEYAFDTGSMTGGIWSFSMFCSESLLFLSIVVLFSNARHNVLWFLILTGINGINLLHGTRIFFMVAAIAFCFNLYVRGKLTFRLGILAFCSTLVLGYLVFLSRSHVEVDDQTFSPTRVISPVVAESVLSQLSLIGTIKHPEIWSFWGSPPDFFLDALYFVTPRFLLSGKDELLFINRFGDLSPLGGFSGYAEGLIYFGVFFPLFYFIVGIMVDWLVRHARHSQFWSAIYVYFVCDFLFHIMRGYAMSIKMLINGLVILVFIILLSHAQTLLTPSRQVINTSPQPDNNLG